MTITLDHIQLAVTIICSIGSGAIVVGGFAWGIYKHIHSTEKKVTEQYFANFVELDKQREIYRDKELARIVEITEGYHKEAVQFRTDILSRFDSLSQKMENFALNQRDYVTSKQCEHNRETCLCLDQIKEIKKQLALLDFNKTSNLIDLLTKTNQQIGE